MTTAAEQCCRHEVLASGPIAQIQRRTECGVLAVSLGAVTLRVHASAAQSLHETLGEALEALTRERRLDATIRARFHS